MQMVITLRSDRRKKGWGEHSVANMEKSMKLQGLYIHPASFKNHTHLLPDCPQGTILEKKLQITHFSHSSASLTLLIIKESFVDHVEPGLKQSTWIWIHSYNFHISFQCLGKAESVQVTLGKAGSVLVTHCPKCQDPHLIIKSHIWIVPWDKVSSLIHIYLQQIFLITEEPRL